MASTFIQLLTKRNWKSPQLFAQNPLLSIFHRACHIEDTQYILLEALSRVTLVETGVGDFQAVTPIFFPQWPLKYLSTMSNVQ